MYSRVQFWAKAFLWLPGSGALYAVERVARDDVAADEAHRRVGLSTRLRRIGQATTLCHWCSGRTRSSVCVRVHTGMDIVHIIAFALWMTFARSHAHRSVVELYTLELQTTHYCTTRIRVESRKSIAYGQLVAVEHERHAPLLHHVAQLQQRRQRAAPDLHAAPRSHSRSLYRSLTDRTYAHVLP